MTSHSLCWQEITPGIYKRGLDECETFHRICTRNEHRCFPVTGSASFTFEPLSENKNSLFIEDAFLKAWITLRSRHPSLASWLEHDVVSDQWLRVYHSISETQSEDIIDRWLEKTYSVVRTESSGDVWFNHDTPDLEPASLYLVHTVNHPRTWSVLLRCPHDITDGNGVLLLLEQLLAYAAQALEHGPKFVLLTWGNEEARLSPCLRIAAGIPKVLSSKQSQRLQDIMAGNGRLYNHPRLLRLPCSRSRGTPASSRKMRGAFQLPKATSEKVLHDCKTLGFTVTHVFTAALAMVLSQLQKSPADEGPPEARYVNHSIINLRPYCPAPYNGPAYAAAACHTISAQALAVDLANSDSESCTEDLLQIASKVRDFFESNSPPNRPHQTTTVLIKSLWPPQPSRLLPLKQEQNATRGLILNLVR